MNSTRNQKHTNIGMELLRNLVQNNKRIFTVEDARKSAPSVGIKDAYVLEALHYLSNTRWISRLRRGLYAVSSSFPGMTPVHEFEVAMSLVNPAAISHWSALHFHGMTEQASQKVFITTTQVIIPANASKPKGSRRTSGIEINGIVYEFVRSKPDRFFGGKEYWVGEVRVTITDPERTIIDGLVNPGYFGDWAEVYSALSTNISKLDLHKMVDYTIRLGEAAVIKRLGWQLERLGADNAILQKLESVPINGYRVLDPTGTRTGHCNKRWMIQENRRVE